MRAALRGRELRPVNVAEANRPQQGERQGFRLSHMFSRVSAGDLALITRQLATLIDSNLPIDEALQAAAQQRRSGRIKGIELALPAHIDAARPGRASVPQCPARQLEEDVHQLPPDPARAACSPSAPCTVAMRSACCTIAVRPS